MEYWEFLIQREGDRGWRTIETGNLQLTEGKYRIVANSDITNTQIQIRVTHQTADSVPQRRSQSRTQTTNPRGLLAVIPFTSLQSGIWKFVCSGTNPQGDWQRILKLRVLPRISTSVPVSLGRDAAAPTVAARPDPSDLYEPTTTADRARHSTPTKLASTFPTAEDRFEFPAPTEPIVPISLAGAVENWADGLDRLLEQLERESLQPQPPKISRTIPGAIQLTTIFDPPAQLICLDRSTFSGLLPGHPLTISGTCNLQKLSANLIQSVKIDKLSICLRHPQTSEIIVAVEQSLPAQLDTFTFSGKLELPTTDQITLLIGEVNLYDKHNIQLGARGFTVTLSLNSLQESELSLFQQAEESPATTAELLDRLTAELQLETTIMGARRPIQHGTPSVIRSLHSPQPVDPTDYHQAALFAHPDITPVKSSPTHFPNHSLDITGDLEIDFALATFVSNHESRNYENLEIVVED